MECAKIAAQGPETWPKQKSIKLLACKCYIFLLYIYFPIGLFHLLFSKKYAQHKNAVRNEMQNENGSWFLLSIRFFSFFVFFGLKVLDLFCC